jgi:3-hydroxyacyl-CoA dehydrogenase
MDDDVKRRIISALYKKISEKKLWGDKNTAGIYRYYSNQYRIGERNNLKRNQKKYKSYLVG